MIDHLPDLDADFLAIYGIDLADPDCDMSAERFFGLVWRLFHREGSMRTHLEAEQAEQQDGVQPAPRGVGPTPGTYTPADTPQNQVDADGTRWVQPDQMKHLFPDLF